MKRKIYLMFLSKFVPLCWIDERKNGIYIGPIDELGGIHFSYHQNGKRHFTIRKSHNSHDRHNFAPISEIRSWQQIGGFTSIGSIAEMNWADAAAVKSEKDIIIELDERTNENVPLMYGLFLCRSKLLQNLIKHVKSGGPIHKDLCHEFSLSIFPDIIGVIQLQFNILPNHCM